MNVIILYVHAYIVSLFENMYTAESVECLYVNAWKSVCVSNPSDPTSQVCASKMLSW